MKVAINTIVIAAGTIACWPSMGTKIELPQPRASQPPPRFAARPDKSICGDWLTFRGGQAMVGVSPCFLPKSLSLAWSFKTGGPVKSSAVVHERRVFVGSNDGNFYALDLESGTKRWVFKTEGAIE